MLKISLRIAGRTLVLLRRIALAVVLLLAFASAGLILTLRYAVLPDIERYHNDITNSVGKSIGLAVEIGKIEADWHGIGPHLRLSEIRILDKQKRTTLALQHVDVVVSWKTLLTGELRLASLEIDQPDLMVKRDIHGALHISGIQMGGESKDNNFANMLLKQSRIVVRGARISWLDEQHAKPLLNFEQVNLLIENTWNFHRFAVRAIPPAELSTQLDVRGDFYGKNFDEMQGWSGEIFTQLDYANLPAWKTWLPLPDALKRGTGAVRGWLGVEDGKISQLTADLELVNVQTRLAADLPPLDIRVLRGRMGWRDAAQGFEISTQKFSLKLFNNFVLKPTDVLVRLSNLQDAALSTGEIHANQLELEGLGKLMEYLPLQHSLKNQFAAFSPQGNVENLQVQWRTDSASNLHYRVKGKVAGLSLQRVGRLPGFSGLSGEVNGSESSGTVSINSRNLKLDAPQFMPEPLAFDTISGQSSWESTADGFEVTLNNIAVTNADIAGTAYGSYQTLPGSPGKLDLDVHLTRASLPHAGRYIPLVALGSGARTWINKSLLEGQSSDFSLRLKGDLRDFPFVDNKKGIFKVYARAKGVALEYVPGWPQINNGTADLSIQGKGLVATASSAMMAGVRLKNIRATMPDVLKKDLMLLIQGEAEGENAHALAFINSSPLRGYLGGFTDDIIARGNGKLNLKLDIPLGGDQPVKVAGTYHLTDSEVELNRNLPALRKVNGDLAFTESGVTTKNIVANILGGPARLMIESSEGGAMNIKLDGKANLAALREINPQPILGKLTGDPAWNLEIAVQNKKSKVLFTSSLKGLQSDLPVPLAKQAGESMPLRFEMNDLSMDEQSMTLQYGSLLNVHILRQKDEDDVWNIERGVINFGNVAQKLDRDGLWLTGTLPRLSLEGWSVLAGAVNGGGEGAPINLAGADLSIQQLSGYGNIVSDLLIKANTRNGMLMAQLASKEVNGEVSWRPGGKGRLVVRLKNLDLALEERKAGKQDMADVSVQTKALAHLELPVIDLVVDRLSLKGRALGKLELLAQQQDQIYLLDHMRLLNPDGVLAVDGQWNMSEDAPQTQVNVKLDIGNAGNILTRSGYPNSVKNGSGKMEGSFTWPGTPAMFSKARLNGKLSMDTGKGQFLQIDPGIGKLLSILSLQALPKRITLDFEDVFSKGFEFDKISATADIKQGVIFTDNLKLEGSSAKVAMAGQMDLNNETQDLRVRIVPTVGNSVALISALVATPVVGAGVYLAGKILNDPLGQMVSFEYNITGSWVDPKVEKVSINKSAEKTAN
ncbi:MAG TPA: YhdP family protein [Gallionellaceae bacterium]|nr:YhdP family protein [Gallionellaceae bacterium]